MFGVSFLEIAVVGLIALIVVGPQKLPGMMRTAGEWVGKLRKMTSDMRKQTGIDDILREEGIDGVQELRTLLRGGGLRDMAMGSRSHSTTGPGIQYTEDPDPTLEFPIEGVDAAGALPDDLFSDEVEEQGLHGSSGSGPNNGTESPDQSQNAADAQLSSSPTHSATPRTAASSDAPGNPTQQK